jgi:hypothetical protein
VWREVRRFRHPAAGEEQDVGIAARAMFLEFGTSRMEKRPFIYPAWDRYKRMLPELIALAFGTMSGGRGGFGRDIGRIFGA